MSNPETIAGQRVNNAQQMGLAALPDKINHHVGAAATNIVKPIDATRPLNYLILHAEVESFRLQVGDTTATIDPYAIPSAIVDDDSGTLAIEEGEIYVFDAPDSITVVGESANSVLTYSWV